MFASSVSGLAGGVGVAVGEPVGVAVGVAVGDGVGVGDVNAFPSKRPGFVEFGVAGRAVVAFELNAIHLPSADIVGREFVISTRRFSNDSGAVEAGLKRTLLVSVIWKMRLWA
jgi:hypothetical protein